MKIVLQGFVTALFFLYSCTSDVSKTDWVRDGLEGKVKTIDEKIFSAIKDETGGIVEDDIYYKHIYSYDNVGKWLQTDSYDSNSKLFNQHIVRYNEGGNRIESIQYTADGKVSFKHIYRFDDLGNEIEKSVYNPDGSIFKKYVYAYDDIGNQIKVDNFNDRGDLFDQYDLKYDDHNYLKEGNRINLDASENRKDIFTNDDRGNPIEISSYNLNGQLTSREFFIYEFDNKGNWVKKTSLDHNKDPISILKRVIEYF